MTAPSYKPGDTVRVRIAHPPGHVRTPHFIRGRTGTVSGILGSFENPEELAYGRRSGAALALYRVTFNQREVWPNYAGPATDTLVVDLYETWLEPNA